MKIIGYILFLIVHNGGIEKAPVTNSLSMMTREECTQAAKIVNDDVQWTLATCIPVLDK